MNNRRTFVKRGAGMLAALGLSLEACATATDNTQSTTNNTSKSGSTLDNPLVIFDNFHVGNRRSYSWKTKFAHAISAGFDGFEFAGADPRSDSWKEAMDLVPKTNFSLWGFHGTTRAVIDKNADRINEDIEKILDNVEILGKSPLKPYYTLSLSGTDELGGSSIAEKGSAKAQDRHWARAYKIISAFDKACKVNGVRGSLYPHIDWICDTPQSQVKILEGANATNIGPAFCSHHWYSNSASMDVDEAFKLPIMERLNYVVMTNVRLKKTNGKTTGMQAVRFDEGEIDMAWMLAKILELGYKGPISSQGWAIGGDPYIACKRFVDGMKALKKRFNEQPELYPL